jgi:HEAT repeat protein
MHPDTLTTVEGLPGADPTAALDPVARLEQLLDMLRRDDAVGAIDVAEALAVSSRHPSVRWKAVETLVALDAASGLRALHRALRDEHALVRHAAATFIEALETSDSLDRAA